MLLRITRLRSLRIHVNPLTSLQTRSNSNNPPSSPPPTVVPPERLITPDLEKQDAAKELALRTQQAPNRDKTWAPSQRPRSEAFNHPKFEGAIIEMQPRPMAAIELIAEQPIHYIDERIAVCDGGGGPRGHPKIFINVDKPGSHACGYCGLRYAASKGQHEALSGVGAASTTFPLDGTTQDVIENK